MEIIALEDTIIFKTSGKVFDPDVIVMYISFTHATITKHGQQVIYMIKYIIWLSILLSNEQFIAHPIIDIKARCKYCIELYMTLYMWYTIKPHIFAWQSYLCVSIRYQPYTCVHAQAHWQGYAAAPHSEHDAQKNIHYLRCFVCLRMSSWAQIGNSLAQSV